jgi:hypothetical protein
MKTRTARTIPQLKRSLKLAYEAARRLDFREAPPYPTYQQRRLASQRVRRAEEALQIAASADSKLGRSEGLNDAG